MLNDSTSEKRPLLRPRQTRSAQSERVFRVGCVAFSLALAFDGTRRIVSGDGGADAAPQLKARLEDLGANAAAATGSAAKRPKRPNVVIALLDDMGFNDAPWTSTDLGAAMPYTLGLAREGVILANYYADKSCTPARAALLTGRHAVELGVSATITWDSAWGVDVSAPLLPAMLERAAPGAYHKACVGKWDLGHAHADYLPLSRGFDAFVGMASDMFVDYATHVAAFTNSGPIYDMFEGDAPTADYADADATDVWTGAALSAIESAATQSKSLFLYLAYNAIHTIITLPAEMTAAADPEYGALTSRIDAGDYTDERRLAAGALLVVDRSLQTVAASLQRSGEWDDTLLVFASDNGGLAGSGGSNYPLRGEMLTYFEGGVRVPAFLYAGANLAHLRMTAGTTYGGLVHASDVAPTLIGAAFAPTGDIDLGFYGLDLHRRVLAGDAAAPARRSLFYGAALAAGVGDIDLGGAAKTPVLAAVRDERHKLITNAAYCDAADTDSTVSCACDDYRTFLFDLAVDPEENDDVSADRPDVVEALLKTLKANIGALVPATGAQNVNEADDALAAATAAAVAAGDSKLFLAPWRTEMVDYAADSFTTLALEDAQRVRRCPPVDFVFLLSLIGSIRRPRTRPRPPRSRASACRSTWSRCARTPRRSSKLGTGSSPPPYKALCARVDSGRHWIESRHWAGPRR